MRENPLKLPPVMLASLFRLTSFMYFSSLNETSRPYDFLNRKGNPSWWSIAGDLLGKTLINPFVWLLPALALLWRRKRLCALPLVYVVYVIGVHTPIAAIPRCSVEAVPFVFLLIAGAVSLWTQARPAGKRNPDPISH